jgi:hypothetical protein
LFGVLNGDEMISSTTDTEVAVVLFGSRARKFDFDACSDVDLLLLSSRMSGTNFFGTHPISCNPQYMSWSQFERLLRIDTPFAKHMRAEAKVISDPSGRASDFLASISLERNSPYHLPEHEDTLEFLSILPRHELVDAFLADIAFTVARSRAIRMALNDEVLAFSTIDLEGYLHRKGGRRKRPVEGLLTALRPMKAAYRGTLGFVNVGRHDKRLHYMFCDTLNTAFSVQRGSIEESLENALQFAAKTERDNYSRIRCLELIIHLLAILYFRRAGQMSVRAMSSSQLLLFFKMAIGFGHREVLAPILRAIRNPGWYWQGELDIEPAVKCLWAETNALT